MNFLVVCSDTIDADKWKTNTQNNEPDESQLRNDGNVPPSPTCPRLNGYRCAQQPVLVDGLTVGPLRAYI